MYCIYMPKTKHKKITRKYRKVPIKNRSGNNMFKRRYLATRRYRGGLNNTDEEQINDLKNIISKYISDNKKLGSLETPKYLNNKENIELFEKNISNKLVKELTEEDLAIIKKLAIQIIDDTNNMSFITKGISQIQKLINKFVLYFINDIEMTDNTEFILKKRITNNMPYLDVVRKKDGYETTYDVNEMFALIKSELNSTEYSNNLKTSLLKKLTIDSKLGLEPLSSA